jgi:hypothetical protein
VLAEGALRPLEPERRFELAVLIELAHALDKALDAGGLPARSEALAQACTHGSTSSNCICGRALIGPVS